MLKTLLAWQLLIWHSEKTYNRDEMIGEEGL